MFQFAGFASRTYGFSAGSSRRMGFPHSEIVGSKPARGSPTLFAACHVLHRLLAPRHPPDALHCSRACPRDWSDRSRGRVTPRSLRSAILDGTRSAKTIHSGQTPERTASLFGTHPKDTPRGSLPARMPSFLFTMCNSKYRLARMPAVVTEPGTPGAKGGSSLRSLPPSSGSADARSCARFAPDFHLRTLARPIACGERWKWRRTGSNR